MSPVRLIEGQVEPLPTLEEERIVELEAEVEELRNALTTAKAETRQAKAEATRALANLRRQLQPLYRALQGVFGELDAAGIEDAAPPAAASNPRVAAVWESWKSRLAPGCGKVIDALLVHGELNSAQIKVAARLGTSTVSDSIYKLNKAGLITKNGGRFSLKTL